MFDVSKWTEVGLKPEMYSFLVENNEHKETKGMNKTVVPRISQDECKVYCWVKKDQSKDQRIETYEINKINCPVLMTKCISKTMDVMSQIWLPELIIKDSYLNNYLKKLSC